MSPASTTQDTPARGWSWRFAAALAALFVFRTAFGLSSDFFFEDQTQIFLIGLRYYATGRWPFFGPDVVWTRSQIPGALQGLTVGLPLRIVAAPESPFIAVNLLSFAALCLFAWYVTRVLPQVPRWLTYTWFLTIPWTLHISTTVINPSYVLPAAIVFFVGFFEAAEPFPAGLLRPAVAHVLMGAALLSAAQFHLSWPLLVPFAAYAWLSRWRDGTAAMAKYALAFVAGAALPFALIVPTLWRYGLAGGSGGTVANFDVHPVNPSILVTSLARLLSFASLEINRFIATDGAKRVEVLQQHWWLIAPAAVVWLAGMVQPLWMAYELCRPMARWPIAAMAARWRALKYLVAASAVLVYFSYWFVMEPAQAHAFYVLSPIMLMLAAYCWVFIDSPAARRGAAILTATNIAFHVGFAAVQFDDKSLYRRREVVSAAIRTKQPEMLGHRRAFARDAGPYTISLAVPYNPLRDLVIAKNSFVPRFDGSVHWTITVKNDSRQVAYRDLLYIATYRYAGKPDVERHEFIKDIFEPCDSRVIDFNDGYVERGFESATIRVAAAEPLVPAVTRCEGVETTGQP